jgi:hypothetical protein
MLKLKSRVIWRELTSFDVRWYQMTRHMTSDGVIWRQMASYDLRWRHMTSDDVSSRHEDNLTGSAVWFVWSYNNKRTTFIWQIGKKLIREKLTLSPDSKITFSHNATINNISKIWYFRNSAFLLKIHSFNLKKSTRRDVRKIS